MLIGTGGTPEGIIAAAAMRCMGGQLLARLAPTDAAERQKAIDAGHDPDQILTTQDLVAGENVFFSATGVTDGDLLRGVRYTGTGAHTQSIVMRKSCVPNRGPSGSSVPTTASTSCASTRAATSHWQASRFRHLRGFLSLRVSTVPLERTGRRVAAPSAFNDYL